MGKPPFTQAEKKYLDSEFERFRKTGFGINPNQIALRHIDDAPRCPCHFCAGTPIDYTREMIPVHAFRRIERNPLPAVAHLRNPW